MLMIDIKAIREAFNEVIVNGFMWIRREYIIAGAITKHTIIPQLVTNRKNNVWGLLISSSHTCYGNKGHITQGGPIDSKRRTARQ